MKIGVDPHGHGTRQVLNQVHEVAHLADDAPAPLLRIVHPVVGRHGAGVDGAVHGQGFGNAGEALFEPAGEGGEAAVKTHHQISDFGMVMSKPYRPETGL